MNPSTVRFCLICIFLCARFFTSAQTLPQADSLFQRGEFLQAGIAYERLIYQGDKRVNTLLLKKAYCYKARHLYEEAYQILQRADLFIEHDSLKWDLYYESMLTAWLAGKNDLAMNKVQELRYYFPSVAHPMTDLVEILSLNQQHRFADAEIKLKAAIRNHHLTGDSLIYQDRRFRLRNPEKAHDLSLFLPGVGQWYAGYTGRGLTSGLIQAGFVAFTITSFLNGYYLSGVYTGVGLFYLFNSGGARHARYLAEKKNGEIVENLNAAVQERFRSAVLKK